MDKKRIFNLACSIAENAHFKQWRRDGRPYIVHCFGVAEKLKNESEEIITAAMLHDVIEDSPRYEKWLSEYMIPQSVIDIVMLLTRKENISYKTYLVKIKNNESARKIKIADIEYNLEDDPTKKQKEKYIKALKFLKDK